MSTQTPDTQQRLYTTHEIANLVQMDPSTISKWIDKGLLLAFRTPGGHRRVRGADLLSFLNAHKMPVPAELLVGAVVADGTPTQSVTVTCESEAMARLAAIHGYKAKKVVSIENVGIAGHKRFQWRITYVA